MSLSEDAKQQRHKERQQKVKENVDKKIANAQVEKGLLLVITGNGKGKSTSGFGTVHARSVTARNALWHNLSKAHGITANVTCSKS
ncbi:Cob(I)alamin adenosyltransferase [Vibrio variabilis]|uniref:Cob(I)alamin adenosyltransferase n=1 Tax=Vibrio variabilis TaxID=990271 RepID=A0ABQ0JEM6_9VIBR|nr:Cob(I)alamin adenosyltransferase [Vibrio variabilis]